MYSWQRVAVRTVRVYDAIASSRSATGLIDPPWSLLHRLALGTVNLRVCTRLGSLETSSHCRLPIHGSPTQA